MKFTEAWDKLTEQNKLLRLSAVAAGLGCVGLSIAMIYLADRPPLVIDRACEAQVAKLTPANQHSESEIQNFLSQALAQRFDSEDVKQLNFLSVPEQGRRQKEQEQLKLRGLLQKIVPRLQAIQTTPSKDADGLSFIINSDRILAVGTVRSAFLFPLRVMLVSVDRTQANPYGLLIQSVEAQDPTQPVAPSAASKNGGRS